MSELSFQVSAPLKLTLETGETLTIRHWSLEGLTYPETKDILPKSALLTIPFQGVDISFPVTFDQGEQPGRLKFRNLGGRERETLAVFYRSVLSGRMVGTDEIITSLDTPVDLVPMGETEEEKTAGTRGKAPRSLRVIWNVVFYLLLSLAIFGTVGKQIWNRISHIPMQHARIVAPIIMLRNADAAYVDEILVLPGQNVVRGETLIRLSLPEHEAELSDIRGDIREAEARLRSLEETRERHLETGNPTRTRLLAALRNAIAARRPADFFAGRDLADVFSAWQALQDFDAAAPLAQGAFFDVLRGFDEQIQVQRAYLRRLKRDLGNHKDAMDAVDIVATSNGTVGQIDVFEDQYIARGTPVISIEENSPRVVKTWLNEERSQAIYPGMQVDIRFAQGAGTRSVRGVISDIQAGTDPDVSDAFGMIVTAEISDMSIARLRETFRHNAPVSVQAVKDWSGLWPGF